MTENNINISHILSIFNKESKYEKLKSKYISEKKKIDIITSIDNYKLEYKNTIEKIKSEDEKILINIEKSIQKSINNVKLYKKLINNSKEILTLLNNEKKNFENISSNYELLIRNNDVNINILDTNIVFINKNQLSKSDMFIVNNFYKLVEKYNIDIFKKDKILPFLSIQSINRLKLEIKSKQKNIIDVKIKLNKVRNKIEKDYKLRIEENKIKLTSIKNIIINTRNKINNETDKTDNSKLNFFKNKIINPKTLSFLKYSNSDTKEIFILIKEFKNECKKNNSINEEKSDKLKGILDEMQSIDYKLQNNFNNFNDYNSNKKINFVIKNELSLMIFFNNINKKFINDKIKNIKIISDELQQINNLLKKESENVNLLNEKKLNFNKKDINWKINNYKIYEYYYNYIEKIKQNILKKYKKLID